jgi:hypothetical protein
MSQARITSQSFIVIIWQCYNYGIESIHKACDGMHLDLLLVWIHQVDFCKSSTDYHQLIDLCWLLTDDRITKLNIVDYLVIMWCTTALIIKSVYRFKKNKNTSLWETDCRPSASQTPCQGYPRSCSCKSTGYSLSSCSKCWFQSCGCSSCQ